MYRDDEGVIWAPNQAKSMLRLDVKKDKLDLVKDTNLFTNIISSKKDANGDRWMGTWSNGLKKIDHQTHVVSTFMHPAPGSSIVPKSIFSFLFDGLML